MVVLTTGMAAFLDCLQQFKEEVEKGDSGFHLPYDMEKGKIKDPSTGTRQQYFMAGFFPFKSMLCWYIFEIFDISLTYQVSLYSSQGTHFLSRLSSTVRSSGLKPWSTCSPTSSGAWPGSPASTPSRSSVGGWWTPLVTLQIIKWFLKLHCDLSTD